jgi:hypothetical protein
LRDDAWRSYVGRSTNFDTAKCGECGDKYQCFLLPECDFASFGFPNIKLGDVVHQGKIMYVVSSEPYLSNRAHWEWKYLSKVKDKFVERTESYNMYDTDTEAFVNKLVADAKKIQDKYNVLLAKGKELKSENILR